MCVCRGVQRERYVTNANPASPLMCVCVPVLCVFGGLGVTLLGSEDSGEGQKSAECVFICVCGAPTIVSHHRVCMCVRGVLHHSVRDHISAPLTKTPIKLPTMKTKLNSYAPI